MITLVCCALLAGLTLLYALFALVSWRYASHQQDKEDFEEQIAPSVSIIKPVWGATEETYLNLASFCRQEYPAPYEILFVAARETDPVVTVLRRLQHDFASSCAIRVVFSTPLGQGLEKIQNLAAGAEASRHELIICTDSDVRVPPDFIKRLVAPLANEEVGLVTSAYHYRSPSNVPAWLEAIFAIRVSAFMLFWGAQRSLKGVMGGCYALSHDVLKEIGGFRALATAVTDDLTIGHLVRRQGYWIHLTPWPVDVYPGHEDIRGFFWRMVRWYVMTRFTFAKFFWLVLPSSFLPIVLTLFYAQLSMIKGSSTGTAMLLLGWAMALRLLAMGGTAVFFLRDLWLVAFSWLTIPLDLVDAMIWTVAAFQTSFTWSGITYQIVREETRFGVRKVCRELQNGQVHATTGTNADLKPFPFGNYQE